MIAAILLAAAASTTIADLRWKERVLIVAAPATDDPQLIEQRRLLANWADGAAERDLRVVEVIGGDVRGVGERAPALRRRWKLPAGRFTVVLIGKDGGEKLRAAKPFTAAALTATIDAMPMRRAGGR